jgi:hypothetical protein
VNAATVIGSAALRLYAARVIGSAALQGCLTAGRPEGLRYAWRRAFVLSWLIVAACAVNARAQQTHVLVVTGVPGDDEHAQKFQKWATTFIDAAKKTEAVPDANITYLSDKKATRDGIDAAFTALAARAKPGDTAIVLLIGHGSFDGRQAAFNIMGPDLTDADWAKLLARIPSHVAFVNTTSSSGAFLKAVSAPGRVVITATKTGGEKLDTMFPEVFVEAFADDGADRDRNGHVSLLEAFEYAKAKVTQAYQQKGLLLTEHATIDDGGEGRAATMFLGIGRTDAAAQADLSDPAVRAIVAERDAIERDIAALKLMKATTDPAKYDAQMEKLLTDLALKTKALRDRQTKKDERR